MTDTNPPQAEGSRAVPAGNGWQWIVDGWRLFKKQPGLWIGIAVAVFLIAALMSAVPLVGGLVNALLLTVLGGGVMLGCRALDAGGELGFGHLFAGFQRNTGHLILVGVFTAVATAVVMIVFGLIAGGSVMMAMMHGNVAAIMTAGAAVMLALLVALALSVPIAMAMWFAPALVVFRNMAPVDALKASFTACLKNIVPFTVYGFAAIVLSAIAAIPFGLGFLVLGPVFMASVYTGYRDIFGAPA